MKFRHSLRRVVLLVSIFFSVLAANAKVEEVPFIILPSGQLVVEVEFSEPIGKQYMMFESSGSNYIRNDQKVRLSTMGIDVLEKSVKKTVKIGKLEFSDVKFKLTHKLGQKGKYGFPDPVLGTLGPRFFKKKVVQIDYANLKFRIADSSEELAISKDARSMYFRSSFYNKAPSILVTTTEFGEQLLYINTCLPLGITFNWTALTTTMKKRFMASMTNYKINLYGNDELIRGYEVDEVFLETDHAVVGHEVVFTDQFMPSIGNEFLKHFVFTIDFKDQKLYFDPADEKAHEFFKD